MQITLTYHNPTVLPAVPEEGRGRLVWVLHDQFSSHWQYTNRDISGTNAGTPATCKAADSQLEPMDEYYQNYWLRWIGHFAHGRSVAGNKDAFNDVTHGAKAFCNKRGTEEDGGYRNYVMGWNEDRQDAAQETIVCTGNALVRVPGRDKNVGGDPCIAVLALDRSYTLPEPDDFIENNKLWNCFITTATVITRLSTNAPIFPSTVSGLPTDWKGNRQVDPFPNNAAYATQITPVPFASRVGEQIVFMDLHCRIKYIRSNRLVSLPDNEFPVKPFVPKVL